VNIPLEDAPVTQREHDLLNSQVEANTDSIKRMWTWMRRNAPTAYYTLAAIAVVAGLVVTVSNSDSNKEETIESIHRNKDSTRMMFFRELPSIVTSAVAQADSPLHARLDVTNAKEDSIIKMQGQQSNDLSYLKGQISILSRVALRTSNLTLDSAKRPLTSKYQ
jgi:hypothetical protein